MTMPNERPRRSIISNYSTPTPPMPEERRGTIWALDYDGEGGFYFEGHSTTLDPKSLEEKVEGEKVQGEEYGWFCMEFCETDAEQNQVDLLREAELLGFSTAQVFAALLKSLHEAVD